MAEPISTPSRRPPIPVAILGLCIVVSAAIRSVFAWRHSVPTLSPDEYIYAALGRSIGHGHLQIRGETVHFPGLLEPIVAAPIWRLFPVETAYHLLQVENAVFASLAAIPIYFLARTLRLSTRYALLAAIYALLIPELVLVSYTSSDMVGYPFAVAAVAAGVASLDWPTNTKQAIFILLASLATLARVEYFVLAPAYVVAAVLLDRRTAWRQHRIALAALIPAAALALIGAFGYYLKGSQPFLVHASYSRWLYVQPYLLAIELGVAIVPGAIAALLKPRSRRELAFAAFVGPFVLLLFLETTKAAAEKLEFKERYLFVLLALVPVAFGLYIRNLRPLRITTIVIAALLAVAALRLPLTEFATAGFNFESQFLTAVGESQNRFGAATTSLAIAVSAVVAAFVAIALTARGYWTRTVHWTVPVTITLTIAIAASVVATRADLRSTRAIRRELPADLRWVDHATTTHVTAVETPFALEQDLFYHLYWNISITREVLLGTAIAADVFSAPPLRIGDDGALENVKGNVLFHEFGTTARFANGQTLAAHDHFVLWRPRGTPRLRLVIEGRFWDSWLNETGRIRAWPKSGGHATRLAFRLSLPKIWAKPDPSVLIGGRTLRVRPGQTIDVVCTSKQGMLDLPVTSSSTWISPDFRRLAMRMTNITVSDAVPGTIRKPACTTARP